MLQFRQICRMVMLSSAGMLILFGVPDASAQKKKKMTYEQAYRQCKAQLDRTFPPGSQSQSGRNTAGVACMYQLGFQAKKSRNF
jgi:hypothetical protein